MTQNKPLCPLAWAIPPSPLMLKCGNDYYTCSKCGEKVDKPEPQIFSRVTSYDDTKPQSVGVEVTDGIHLCKGCNTMKHVDADGFCGRCRPVGVEGEIDLKLFRAIANANHYGSKRTRGEANEDMHYEEMQPKSQMLVARIKDIYRPIITSLLAQEREKAVIADRLEIHQRFNSIHRKYPNDGYESDRDFRNDFMSEFSTFMDETTQLIKSNQLSSGESNP